MNFSRSNGKRHSVNSKWHAELKNSACRDGEGSQFADLSVSAVLCRSSVENVESPEDCMLEEVCSRRDFACGVDAS